jgi:hypothetical protein
VRPGRLHGNPHLRRRHPPRAFTPPALPGAPKGRQRGSAQAGGRMAAARGGRARLVSRRPRGPTWWAARPPPAATHDGRCLEGHGRQRAAGGGGAQRGRLEHGGLQAADGQHVAGRHLLPGGRGGGRLRRRRR